MTQTMKIEYIDHTQIVLDDEEFHNPRTIIDAGKINELVTSIATYGLLSPIEVERTLINGEERYRCRNGGRRLRGWKKLYKAKKVDKKIAVIVSTSKDIVESRLKALEANIQSEQLSGYEIAEALAALVDDGKKQKDLAKRISKSATYVSRALSSWNKSTNEVKFAWKRGLPDDDVQTLVKLKPDEQNKRVQKMVELRDKAASATKKDRKKLSAARSVAKEGTVKSTRMSANKLQALIKATKGAPKNKPYVRGLNDALRLAAGEIGIGELDKQWASLPAAKALVGDK